MDDSSELAGPSDLTTASDITFTVNSFLDTVDANPGDGLAADASGATTLRAVTVVPIERPQSLLSL